MRYVDVNLQTIDESEVDLTKGYIQESTIVKPDAIEPDNVTKFAYYDEDYETVKIYFRIPDDEPIKQEIQERKQYLNDTDYVVLKIAEGAATREEYEDVIARRQLAREQINAFEAQLVALGF